MLDYDGFTADLKTGGTELLENKQTEARTRQVFFLASIPSQAQCQGMPRCSLSPIDFYLIGKFSLCSSPGTCPAN